MGLSPHCVNGIKILTHLEARAGLDHLMYLPLNILSVPCAIIHLPLYQHSYPTYEAMRHREVALLAQGHTVRMQ